MNSNIKILITDRVHPLLIEGFKKESWLVNYEPGIQLEEVAKIIHDYSAIIINTKTKMDSAMIERATHLKCISRLGSGLDIIDLEAAKNKNIAVFRSPEGNCNAVAEHVMGMLLALINNLYRSNLEVKNLIWDREKNRGFELSGKTVGIIGFGHTGSSLAKKLASWEVEILAYDKYKEQVGHEFRYVKAVSMEDLQMKSDIISFHVPLTEETEHMANARFFEECIKSPIIINSSRGKVVDTHALINALKNKDISGACLDVFENEKIQTYTKNEKKMYAELFELKDVLVSPHVAGWTKESFEKIAQVTLNKVRDFLLNHEIEKN